LSIFASGVCLGVAEEGTTADVTFRGRDCCRLWLLAGNSASHMIGADRILGVNLDNLARSEKTMQLLSSAAHDTHRICRLPDCHIRVAGDLVVSCHPQ